MSRGFACSGWFSGGIRGVDLPTAGIFSSEAVPVEDGCTVAVGPAAAFGDIEKAFCTGVECVRIHGEGGDGTEVGHDFAGVLGQGGVGGGVRQVGGGRHGDFGEVREGSGTFFFFNFFFFMCCVARWVFSSFFTFFWFFSFFAFFFFVGCGGGGGRGDFLGKSFAFCHLRFAMFAITRLLDAVHACSAWCSARCSARCRVLRRGGIFTSI